METVLLIEGDPANLVALALILHSFGYNVLEADSPGQAWRACHYHHGPIHLLITRAILDNDGTSRFVARLQLVYPKLRVLFVCDAVPAVLDDMPCEFALLTKPFQVETLACTIKGLLQGPRKRAGTSLS